MTTQTKSKPESSNRGRLISVFYSGRCILPVVQIVSCCIVVIDMMQGATNLYREDSVIDIMRMNNDELF